MSVRVEHGDCRSIMPTLGVLADSCVTDPPYDLVAMTKRFGKNYAAAKSPDHQRFARGFMGQQWDGEGVAFDPETWRIVSSALRPGAFLVAFGAPRTHHRLACAIEDAGFVIQDCLMWLFATGFPKRRDMLKPAYEPIVLAYKPGGKRSMQIDECRIGVADADRESWGRLKGFNNTPRTTGLPYAGGAVGEADDRTGYDASGRWPANICLEDCDEVVGAFPRTASGTGAIKRATGSDRDGNTGSALGRESRPAGTPMLSYGDEGSASRFFFSSKAGAQDRWGSRHPTVKPVELMKWLVALVTPPGGLVIDPFAGSGTTAVAALATGRDAILCEREDQYIADIRERLAFYEGGGTHSMQAKNRNRKSDSGPLFAQPEYDPDLDSLLSYNAAVKAVREQVKVGAPVPPFFQATATAPGDPGSGSNTDTTHKINGLSDD